MHMLMHRDHSIPIDADHFSVKMVLSDRHHSITHSSLYLKKSEKIEALLMVMMCCLMVYAALEHKIRQELKEPSVYFPHLKYKPCQNPTAR